jgi:DNA repair protein RadC
MKIKDIPESNQPRQRLIKNGIGVLSDAELLAIIFQKGTKNENAIDMSNRLISKYGVDKLSSCSLKELQKIKGIGQAKSCQILALFEFNKRHNLAKTNGKSITRTKDVFDYCSPKLSCLDKEYLMILHLDSKNRVIKDEIISIGTLNNTLIHPREIFKSAIKESSNSIILVHNHPSGDPTPSEEDEEMTKRMFDAGDLLDIKILDHVIIGKDEFYSFRE